MCFVFFLFFKLLLSPLVFFTLLYLIFCFCLFHHSCLYCRTCESSCAFSRIWQMFTYIIGRCAAAEQAQCLIAVHRLKGYHFKHHCTKVLRVILWMWFITMEYSRDELWLTVRHCCSVGRWMLLCSFSHCPLLSFVLCVCGNSWFPSWGFWWNFKS